MEQVIENTMKVSIIIPVYNHEQFIGDCIQSIINQTYENIEVILCDDCSKDNSWKIMQDYKTLLLSRFKNVVLLKNENNMGITKTLNKMLAYVKGDYVKIIASDDMLVDSCIKKLVDNLEKNKLQILVGNGGIIEEEQLYPVHDFKQKVYNVPPDFTKATMLERLFADNFIFAPRALIKKEIFEKFGIYDETLFTEDWEFWLRVCESGQVEFKYVDDVLVYYRKNKNSMTSMTVTADFENRRIKLHEAEMKIINCYKNKVPRKVYANKVVDTLLRERALAEKWDLKQLLQITGSEIKNFRLWYFTRSRTGIWFIKKKMRIYLSRS